MNIYDKIRRLLGQESYEEKMYSLLNTQKYKERPYETVDLGENMAIINQVVWGWWKPRFILNHNTKTAFEFMDSNENLTTVTENDIDWESLKGLPNKAIQTAQCFSSHFPTFVRGFRNGVAEVSWQLNPDGRYYQDDDGFGMTDDDEIEIYGFIDVKGNVVVPFRYVEESAALKDMRRKAERIVAERQNR